MADGMPVESSLIGRTKFPSCPVSSKKWLGLMTLTTVVHRWSSTEAKKRCNYFSQSRAITKSNRPKQTFPSFDHTSDALFQPSQRAHSDLLLGALHIPGSWVGCRSCYLILPRNRPREPADSCET